ncbi:hypothetical protein B296_00045133 [Ensete ventricosum]|uniref:Uncharacterized protein n=1 Tax=Ensete ventricosum TaxID=4639 RepID=A0A426Z1N0_ENSVE|nr:hypothetical protein B296_00045133 [Ensete ventricosum]
MAADAIVMRKTTARPSWSIKEEAKPHVGASLLLSSYLSLGFALFLGLLPKSSASYVEDMKRVKAELRAVVVRLEREVAERDGMLNFMARKVERDGSLSLMEVAGED